MYFHSFHLLILSLSLFPPRLQIILFHKLFMLMWKIYGQTYLRVAMSLNNFLTIIMETQNLTANMIVVILATTDYYFENRNSYIIPVLKSIYF